MFQKGLVYVLGFLAILAVFIVVSTVVIKISWAYSITTMFGFREPTWTEAFALSCLCSVLFKGYSSSSSRK